MEKRRSWRQIGNLFGGWSLYKRRTVWFCCCCWTPWEYLPLLLQTTDLSTSLHAHIGCNSPRPEARKPSCRWELQSKDCWLWICRTNWRQTREGLAFYIHWHVKLHGSWDSCRKIILGQSSRPFCLCGYYLYNVSWLPTMVASWSQHRQILQVLQGQPLWPVLALLEKQVSILRRIHGFVYHHVLSRAIHAPFNGWCGWAPLVLGGDSKPRRSYCLFHCQGHSYTRVKSRRGNNKGPSSIIAHFLTVRT